MASASAAAAAASSLKRNNSSTSTEGDELIITPQRWQRSWPLLRLHVLQGKNCYVRLLNPSSFLWNGCIALPLTRLILRILIFFSLLTFTWTCSLP